MRPIIIGISGQTNTGKSALAKRACRAFDGVTHVEMDDYFKDEADAPLHQGIPNWDALESIKLDELSAHLRMMQNNASVEIPIYSKPESKQTGTRIAEPSPFIIVEGTFIFSHPEIRDLLALKFFIHTTPDCVLERYTARMHDYSYNTRFLTEVVFPSLETYHATHAPYADHQLDALEKLDTLVPKFFTHLTARFPQLRRNELTV